MRETYQLSLPGMDMNTLCQQSFQKRYTDDYLEIQNCTKVRVICLQIGLQNLFLKDKKSKRKESSQKNSGVRKSTCDTRTLIHIHENKEQRHPRFGTLGYSLRFQLPTGHIWFQICQYRLLLYDHMKYSVSDR